MFVTDLMRVATADARAVIVLSDTSAGDADSCDAKVLRTVLSLRGLPETLRGFIIAELQDVDNRQIVQLIGGDQIEVVVSHDICGRLMLMAARHPGLAVVYDHIFGFKGNEFYLKAWPSLAGRSWGEVCAMFPDAVPVGLNPAAARGRTRTSCTASASAASSASR